MYIPMKIAAEMGENILYQSTTRSPIHPVSNDVNYAIHNHFSYQVLKILLLQITFIIFHLMITMKYLFY